jgi:16S rRNA G1207 methylase RsmC
MKNDTDINFSIGDGEQLDLVYSEGVFFPNATTSLIIQAVKTCITEPVTLLDLGCGTGVVGIALYLNGLIKLPIYMSDLSEEAISCSVKNTQRYGCAAEVRHGSLFQPWSSSKFDVIVDDISGIAQSVAEVSPWFQGVPCDTGIDGIDLVTEVICHAPNFLNPNGKFFFPVLSLSNVDKLLEIANKNFESVSQVCRQEWPLPPELKVHLPLLRKLKEAGYIKLEEKFGMAICFTEVYCATNPIANYK